MKNTTTGLLKITPLWLKIAVAKTVRHFLKSRQTIIVSNAGKFDVPEEMGVEWASFNINVSKNAKVNLGIMSTKGNVTFAFTKSIVESSVADHFFTTLKGLGVNPIN